MWVVPVLMSLAIEVPYDGLDQDGDGRDLIDVDEDGFIGVLAFGPDCADGDPEVHPGARDVPGDLLDADCGGSDRRDRSVFPRRRR